MSATEAQKLLALAQKKSHKRAVVTDDEQRLKIVHAATVMKGAASGEEGDETIIADTGEKTTVDAPKSTKKGSDK